MWKDSKINLMFTMKNDHVVIFLLYLQLFLHQYT